ncbi:MAG: winged helix-turn-helix domain-containing protein [Promethearchaeota archaeon]
MEFQDIVTKKPIAFKFIWDKDTDKLLDDPNYFPIIKVLRKGPMTFKELERAYNKEAEPKSVKTLYRYLKKLEELDIVIPVGQRVVIGKKVTETLYGRTAGAFFSPGEKGSWWKSEKGKDLARQLGILVSKATNKKAPSPDCLQEIIIRFVREKQAILEALAESEKVSEFFWDGDFDEYLKLTDYVALFSFLINQPDFLKDLMACFKE